MNAALHSIQIIEERQGVKILCLEEVSWQSAWLSKENLLYRAEEYYSSLFANYLRELST